MRIFVMEEFLYDTLPTCLHPKANQRVSLIFPVTTATYTVFRHCIYTNLWRFSYGRHGVCDLLSPGTVLALYLHFLPTQNQIKKTDENSEA